MLASTRKGIVATVVALIFISQPCAAAVTVRVTCEVGDPQLYIGQTTALVVTGEVLNPGGADDGIFTFDIDLILGDTSVLSIVPGTVNRPDVDDATFGGSDGTAEAWGLNALAGGYWELDRGITTPQVLFTATVRADAAGISQLTMGPDTDVMGDDFLLNITADPLVDYSQASSVVEVFFPGDTNYDGQVNLTDFNNLVAQFGGPPGVESADCNWDGFVDLEDFAIMRGNLGSGFASAPNAEFGAITPEPATVILMAGGLPLLLRLRRRRI